MNKVICLRSELKLFVSKIASTKNNSCERKFGTSTCFITSNRSIIKYLQYRYFGNTPPHFSKDDGSTTFSPSNSNLIDTETSQEQLIEAQKKRAIDYWINSNKDDPQKMSVHDEVIKKLQQGLVPPIFHTLCRLPEERLFDPITKLLNESNDSVYIQLSTKPVTAGTFNSEASEEDRKGEIKIGIEKSYLNAFFTSDGMPRLEVKDRVLFDPWTFDADFTSFVAALVNEPAKMVGEDIEVTSLQSTFYVDQNKKSNLITRRLSRGVVGDCINKSTTESNYAIVGSPGIGKSWTLLYALQQALLYENVCVLFYAAKRGTAMACIRKGNEVFVWIAPRNICDSNLFHNSRVLVLLDPKEAKDPSGGALFNLGPRMLLFAASNEEKQFAIINKETDGFKKTLGPYLYKELKVAIPFMVIYDDVNAIQKVLHAALERAKIVGNLPRYLVSELKFYDRRAWIEEAIRVFKPDDFQHFLN